MGESGSDLISLPQGGGALRALGETFQPDLHTGTAQYSVPLELPSGRGSLTPHMSLSYSSGNSNGPFGMGWALSTPAVSRRTDKRIPRYDGTDTFVLSGTEDLVPVPGVADAGVQRFRPRTENMFARIEHDTADGDYWTVWSKDGLRTTYGTPRPSAAEPAWRDPAVVADPDHADHITRWLITSTADTFGNTIAYSYSPDPADPAGAARYLSEIGYADYGDPANPNYMVRVRFAYEPRPDRCTDRRGGFPVTTGQRATAIETWTDAGIAQLSRRVALTYSDAADRPADNGASLLTRITVTGHAADGAEQLPPLEFGYSTWDPAQRRYRSFGDSASGASPERSLAGRDLDLVDLFGDGLPDVVQLVGGAARYWRNRGGGVLDRPRTLTPTPAGVSLGATGVQLLDADGDGRPDLMVTDGMRAGYFPINENGAFDPAGYVAYREAPPFGLADPNTRLIDLDGDGVADALRVGTVLECYLNDRAGGWRSLPADGGSPLAAVSFADPRIKLADMTGDGLADVVLIGNGRVTYWPNLGYGRFGAPVVMLASPRFDDASRYGRTGFDPARLLVGDLDGDGAADVAYVGANGTMVWINRSGAGFAPPVTVPATPWPDSATSIRSADLLGTGVAGVLWSFDADAVRGDNYKFLDLTGGTKPYLLSRIDNHAGAVTEITYATSTCFAEADAAAGTPWRTTLPFPVHVVASSRIEDYFSGSMLASEYEYHHGYWDGADREFRGFGRVHRRDALTAAGSGGTLEVPTEVRSWFHLGPVGPEHGAWTDLDLTGEYWLEDPPLTAHVDLSALPANLPRRTLRDAIRAVRGTLLREEMYALDGTSLQPRPYEITDHAVALAPVLDDAPVFTVRPTYKRHVVWERGNDPMYRLQVTGNYDAYGRPADVIDLAAPRGHDPRHPDPAGVTPEPYLAVRTTTTYALRNDATAYIADRVTSVRRDEVLATTALSALDIAHAALSGSVTAETVRSLALTYYDGPAGAGPAAPPDQLGGLPFGQLGDHGAPMRTEQLVITPDRLGAAWQPGVAAAGQSTAAPAYLPLDGVAPPTLPGDYPTQFAAMLPPLAGYTWHAAGTDPTSGADYVAGYYRQSGRTAYDFQSDPGGRGLPVAHRDPLGHDTVVGYDPYRLLRVSITDPLGLTQTAQYDYRILRPILVTDASGNRTQVGYTPLGMPAWTAETGRPGEDKGDTVEQPGLAYAYALTAFDDSAAGSPRQPMSVTTTRRIQHRWTLVEQADAARAVSGQPPLTDQEIAALFPPDEQSVYPQRFLTARDYTDGLGRLLQSRGQADSLILDDLGLTADQNVPGGPARAHRADPTEPVPVVVSGWKQYDGKGRVITAWEACFDTGFDYQPPDSAALGRLAKTTTAYDARGLAVLVTAPDGAQTRTVPGVPAALTDASTYTPTPWVSYVYDPDDNAGRTHPGSSGAFAGQFDTPSSTAVDALGRPTVRIQRLTPSDDGAAVTRTEYDIDGNITVVVDPLGRTSAVAAYDCLRRAWRHQGLDDGTTRIVRDPTDGVVETRDGRGAITLTGYDPGHRATRMWACHATGQTPTLRRMLVYGDEPDSGLSQTAAVAGNLLGRLYQDYDEAGRQTSSSYDIDGNLTTKTRRVFRTDLLLSDLPPGDGAWDRTAYVVDWQPPAGTTLDQYAAGLLDAAEYQTDTEYDALRRVTATTGPAGRDGHRTRTDYTLTPAGQVASIAVDGTAHLSQAVYNARGQRVLVMLGGGTLTRYIYDPGTFRLARIRTESASAAPGSFTWTPTASRQGVAQDYGYEYDLIDNVIALHDRTPGCGLPTGSGPAHSPTPDALDRVFAYDPLYRLLSATGRETALPPTQPWADSPAGVDLTRARAYTETYTYDLAGNLQSLAHVSPTGYTRTYQTAASGNAVAGLRLANGDTFAYTYDAAGNVLSEADVRRHEWDHGGRLVAFRVQTGTAAPSLYGQYRYDGAGRRVMKIVRRGGAAIDVTIYVDGGYERLALSSGPVQDTNHVFDGTRRIAVLRRGDAVPGDPYPTATYHLADHLESSAVVLDAGGAVLNREEYTPYGETSFGGYAKKRYRFTAKERDEESGLGYHGARYYAPWLARWMGPDPARGADGTNPYRYVRSSPMRYTDKTGMAAGDTQSLPPPPPANQCTSADAPAPQPDPAKLFPYGDGMTTAEGHEIGSFMSDWMGHFTAYDNPAGTAELRRAGADEGKHSLGGPRTALVKVLPGPTQEFNYTWKQEIQFPGARVDLKAMVKLEVTLGAADTESPLAAKTTVGNRDSGFSGMQAEFSQHVNDSVASATVEGLGTGHPEVTLASGNTLRTVGIKASPEGGISVELKAAPWKMAVGHGLEATVQASGEVRASVHPTANVNPTAPAPATELAPMTAAQADALAKSTLMITFMALAAVAVKYGWLAAL